MHINTEEIEKVLGYSFKNKDLLIQAFIHKSYLNENACLFEDNERLEFLGDAILNAIVTAYLFTQFSQMPEGKLSHFRAKLICTTSNAEYMQMLGLEVHLLKGKGEHLEVRGALSLTANLFEAIIGALFLDAGFETAERFILQHFEKKMHEFLKKPDENFKAILQHYTQKNFNQKPTYVLQQEKGKEHQKEFFVQAFVDDQELGLGMGKNKKQAEQNAAENALENIAQIEEDYES